MSPDEIDKLARKIWDYHHMKHSLSKADAILALGSNDTRVAERGAQLFLEKWAPVLVFSGGVGILTLGKWKKPEAEIFADIAIKMGVPGEKILVENKSTNTGENIQFTRRLFQERKIRAKKIILVQKPYMERRAYATFKKVWPEMEIIVTSPQFSYEEYPNEEIPKESMINIMAGDLQRVKLYAGRFQIPQEIPEDVWEAYEKLVKEGYTKHLVKE